MKLIILSSPDSIPGENRLINGLFYLGMQRFHLRKPNWSAEQTEQLLNQIEEPFRQHIVLHQHYTLTEEFNLGGIHFTGKSKKDLPRWSTYQGSRSMACHSLGELDELPETINYALLSPVFPSISKPGYTGSFCCDELAAFLPGRKQKQEVIALGGITGEQVPLCREWGFDGVAVLGAIWQHASSPAKLISTFNHLNTRCQQTVHM